MKDPRRRFTARQKQALYAVSGGLCEACGGELEPGWHGDHVHPHSEGGPTDVVNGAALCPTCNHKKGNTMMTDDPREMWQREFEHAYLRRGRQDYLLEVCPGGGKTRAALRVARTLLDSGEIQRVVVVAPTQRVRSQWCAAAEHYGIDLVTEYAIGLPSDCDGAVVTYQRLASSGDTYRTIVGRKRTLVIADEVHHCGEEDRKAWARALRNAAEPAVRRLWMSGTPFRSDGEAIPFVEYDSSGYAVAQRTIGYGEAVRLGICRPVRFELLNGSGVWMKGVQRFTAQAGDATEQELAGLLKSLYQPVGQWIRKVLQEADEELTRMREEKENAAGLVVAQDIPTAKAYAELLRGISGETPLLVHSKNEEDTDAAIDGFAGGTGRWVVAVKMISEGVDIPRLAVLVFASLIRTEMWFRQVVGRITRMDGPSVTATMMIPAVPGLVGMAARVEGEADAGLDQAEQDLRRREEGEQREIGLDLVVPLSSSEPQRQGVITSGTDVTGAELENARKLMDMVGGSLKQTHPGDVAMLVRRLTGNKPVATARAVLPPQPSTRRELRDNLRVQVNRAVNRVARDHEVPHKKIHYTLNSQCGDKLATASVDTLEKRLGLLDRWQ